MAALASGKAKEGNLSAAQDYATIARRWSIGGFAVGVLAWAAYFLFFIVGFSLQA